jgi:hypothetical protein
MRTKNAWEILKVTWQGTSVILCPPMKRKSSVCAACFATRVLHSDFRAARGKLKELGVETRPGGVRKIDLPVVTVEELSKKILGAKAGTEGTFVSDTLSTGEGGVYGWFLDAGMAGDFQKASDAFKRAAAIIDRLAGAAGED